MWPKLERQIAVEWEMLKQLLVEHRDLIQKSITVPPDRIELSALAVMLHVFYSGVENMFKRIAIELDETLPVSPHWHRELLQKMAEPGPQRSAVISAQLAEKLGDYLQFRHFFRNSYTFQFRWDLMAHLVENLETTLQELESEVTTFLSK